MENNSRGWRQSLDVRGIFWRRGLDWAIKNIPSFFHPALVWFWTAFFFFWAGAARKSVLEHLAIILPGSSRALNYFRAFRIFLNFAWTMVDTTIYKFKRPDFSCQLNGAQALHDLLAARGAIVLTAHMGSYDLGAALFAEKFQREIRMVRAPEPDTLSGEHLDRTLEHAGAGGVKVDYNQDGAALSFDLLNRLRQGEIISIQGDRVLGHLAAAPTQLFGREVALPSGPFVLALIASAPIYPLFVVRRGHRQYEIIVREPIMATRTERARAEDIASAMGDWARILEQLGRDHWDQWYVFTPLFRA